MLYGLFLQYPPYYDTRMSADEDRIATAIRCGNLCKFGDARLEKEDEGFIKTKKTTSTLQLASNKN